MKLLKQLCEIHAPSGNESAMTTFLLEYIRKNQSTWKATPQIIHGADFQNCIILKFGTPRTAVFAHIDSIGFTVRYENQLVPIGGPEVKTGYRITGEDDLGKIECSLVVDDEHRLFHDFARPIERGTTLTFKADFRESDDNVQCCYMDNRLGVYNALRLAETLEDGIIVFSCYEEHGGGTVPFLLKYIYEEFGIRQTLISDITWVTDGVLPGEGVAISLRDHNIPRKEYTDRITSIAKKHHIPHQLEVEGNGSSDGREIQLSQYPVDWCFIGAAEKHVHSPDEQVNKKDIESMLQLYQVLMKEL